MVARARSKRRPTQPWDDLHQCIRAAMTDGFAAVAEPDLGDRLRTCIDACLQQPDPPSELGRLREAIEDFDRLGRQDRSVLVARAMRLCAAQRSARAGASKPPPRKPSSRRMESMARAIRDDQGAAADDEAAAKSTGLSVRELSGIGPKTAAKLEARGLSTIVDLAYVLPAGYEDRRHRKPVETLDDGEVAVVEAEVGALRQGFARGRFMASLVLRADDGRGGVVPITARWFHRVSGLEQWARGGRVLAIGPVRRYKGQLTMAHPELRDPGEPGPAIACRYPTVEGLPPRTFARAIGRAVARLSDPDAGFIDALPPELAENQGLPGQLEALRFLHGPPEDLDEPEILALQQGRSAAHRRLAFDEFFFFQLAVLRNRARWRAEPATVRPVAGAFDRDRLRACLPFEPTAAQWRVIDEVEEDMSAGPPMLRLLQGDVGSGKTAVAFAAGLASCQSGGQVALMAPTEILAEQHARTLRPWCEAAGLRLSMLSASTPRAERSSMMALLQAGKIDVLVGTHALLTDDVTFNELGLIVIDEQHRFGVEQRAVLRRKGAMPHLLVMTATPIPRTMALCAYGELEVSVIDELPPGRQAAQTHLFTGKRGLDRMRRGVAKRVAAGDKAFVVCPLVEASDALDVTDVEATTDAIAALLPEHSVATVHGRMRAKDKDAAMSAFRRGEAAVLVATTVIEVGVDVPDARLMAIEHAERFGLAQLHQLRGRVGRGGGQSYCLLHTAAGPGSEVAARLAVLTETSDGFAVAERDLALRGPGEVFGLRQSGAPRLRFAGFAGEGTRLLVQAREAAHRLLERDPDLADHREVRLELLRRKAAQAVLATDAG